MKTLFLWPQEPFLPTSLFKHYVYIGETAAAAKNAGSDISVLDLSVSKISRKSFVDTIEISDLIFVIVEPYTALSSKKLVDSIRSVNSQKKIIGYGTAVTLNPKIFTQIFDYVIPSGFYQDIISNIISGKTLKYDNQRISLETTPVQLNWNNPLLEALPVSASPSESVDSELWAEALKRAKDNNIFVTTTGLIAEYGLFDNGLKREVLGNPDNPVSYSKPKWWNVTKAEEQQKVTLAFPIDYRTTASPTGDTDYTHYVSGGWSWVKPFEAGLYALAKQTDRTITPEQFFEIGLQTGTYSKKAEAVIANPVALIEEVKERKRIRDLQKLKLLSRDM